MTYSPLIRESVQALSAYVPGEQPRDARVVKLNTNENPYPPSPQVTEVLRTMDAATLRFYPDPVAAALRDRIAALHHCAPEQVFVGNGSDEVLALCTRAFVENDGAIGYFDPSYSLYPVLADIRNVRKCPVALDAGFGWQAPPSDGGALFLLTTPNAPTSIQYPRAAVEAFCSAFQGVVVLDEAYVDFASDHYMDLALKYDNVLTMRSLSKSFSLAGIRVGYVVGAAPLIEALMKMKDSYNLDALAQRVALAALEDVETMQANVAKVVATRKRLAAALRESGFEVYPSETNFLWVRPPEAFAAADLFTALRKRNILIRYFSGAKTEAYLRITIGTDADVAALLEALRRIMEG